MKMTVKLKLIGLENEWGSEDWKIVTVDGKIMGLKEAKEAGLIKLRRVWVYKPFKWKYIVELLRPDEIFGFMEIDYRAISRTTVEYIIPLRQMIEIWGE
jgi:hypothetical protein